MYEDIQKNKNKTVLIVLGFSLMITLAIYAVCMLFDLGTISIVIALVFSIASSWYTYYHSDKIVLASVKAKPATPEEYGKLNNILDGLMVASGLEHRPDLYVIDTMQPNAFATGRNPENAVICVTKGLLDRLDYYEIEAVMAHELAHVKNYDILVSTIISVMAGFIIMLSDICTRSFRRGDSDNDMSKAELILMLIGIISLIVSPIVAKLIQLAVSRRREFLADASAVGFTRNPDMLISALQKISSDPNQMATASDSTAHMFIVNPFNKKKEKQKTKSNIFSTHPTLEQRVDAIRNLK